ncbi:hypothetical protein EVAR_71050_1 [Eumeta japonica]|uniref:DUF4780 domain-containing protein n=1 Tax=Eumeta variegata TaxID=151549 RepID=A0A4C1T0X1_EUMVA|nr:hypothetical protein EVAR_71050_1 [Eumeta japonica]
MDYLLTNKGGLVPRFDSGKCIAKISEAWEGLSLKLIPAEEIPMRPRARVWLPKVTWDSSKILECLKLQNPDIHTDEWSVIRIEKADTNLCLILAITEESSAELERQVSSSSLVSGMQKSKSAN